MVKVDASIPPNEPSPNPNEVSFLKKFLGKLFRSKQQKISLSNSPLKIMGEIFETKPKTGAFSRAVVINLKVGEQDLYAKVHRSALGEFNIKSEELTEAIEKNQGDVTSLIRLKVADQLFNKGSEVFEVASQEGIQILKSAADLGNGDAAFKLGDLYSESNTIMDEMHDESCKKWFKIGANNGHTKCMIRLAEIFQRDGEHVLAVSWFNFAAKKGDPEGLAALAFCYETEEKGLKKNLNKALETWNKYLKTPKLNKHLKGDALFNMAEIYEERKDYQKAIDCYTKALKYGNLFARLPLARACITQSIEEYKAGLEEYNDELSDGQILDEIYRVNFEESKAFLEKAAGVLAEEPSSEGYLRLATLFSHDKKRLDQDNFYKDQVKELLTKAIDGDSPEIAKNAKKYLKELS